MRQVGYKPAVPSFGELDIPNLPPYSAWPKDVAQHPHAAHGPDGDWEV